MKNIVLCFDGTDNKFGPEPFTNLLKVFRLLDKEDIKKQICYYQPGIGASMEIETDNLASQFDGVYNTLDSLIAFSLDGHIMKAYKYLMNFYEDGDKIFMFGFSRGAFTARVLCSMIERVGLLNSGLEELVEGAWGIYSAWEYAAQPSQPDYTTTLIDEFQMTFSRYKSIKVEFLGLFDCVNSIGLIRDRMFPFSSKFSIVKQIRHAVSLDERRVKYKQSLIYPNPYKESLFKKSVSSSINESIISEEIVSAKKMIKEIENRLKKLRSNSSNKSNYVDKSKLINGDFQELWFPGNHGDIGGGWEPDKDGQFISNLSLRWVISESIKKGVFFRKDKILEFSNKYSSLDSFLSCIHDVLKFKSNKLTDKRKIKPCERVILYKKLPDKRIQGNDGNGTNSIVRSLLWWILEFLPFYSKVEDDLTNKWRVSYTPNFGRPRTLPKYAKLHWSVYWRIKYCFDYSPKNLPEYLIKLLSEINDEEFDEDNLIRLIKQEAQLNLNEWEADGWKNVPDDLSDTLKEYGYTTNE